MRARNWLLSLALPILAAVSVGIAVVVITGGGGQGGSAPSALAAGFPPARLAAGDFTGATPATPVVLSAIAASGADEAVAGSAAGGPALWVSGDGGSGWRRAAKAPLSGAAGTDELTSVAHGAAGWLAVGGKVVVGSPTGTIWTREGGAPAPGAIASGAAAGSAGYVIVGHRGQDATASYAPGLTGWRRAVVAQAPGGQQSEMSAVAATARGYAAAGGAGANPATWVSAAGRSWQLSVLPLPAGAARATLTSVAASGTDVVAVGSAVSAAGQRWPFAEISANAGASWTQAALPVPVSGGGTATVTALTAAGSGFTATGTYPVAGGSDVVVWTLPATAIPGGSWTAATPQGTGLSGASAQAITALTSEGAELTGVGFTTGKPGTPQQATIWSSPVRY